MPLTTFYYLGSPEHWRSDQHFERLRFRDLYPGIDLVFQTAPGGHLEYTFEIGARAAVRLIRIHYDGLTPHLRPGGILEGNRAALQIFQERPHAFQRRSGRVLRIACRYRISGQDATFEIGNYDAASELVIDPTLTFSTYLGGAGSTTIFGATLDTSGNIYVAGQTSAESMLNPSFPSRPSTVAFVAKLNGAGTQILYLVFLGGSQNDAGMGVAVDSSGNAYITGTTASPDFPVTSGAFLQSAPGTQDAFVAKVNSIGQLQYSTYLGGAGPDAAFSIAVDASGAAYVTGQTESVSFPVTSGASQTIYQGGISDCFVSKLNAAGSALIYSTLLGGSGMDLCTGIALDASNNAYVTGTTGSTNFPTQAAFQSTLVGSSNAFATKINASGTALIYSTYAGGSAYDHGNAIAVDSSGSAYIAGAASSSDFPLTSGAFQVTENGIYNAFVLKLSNTGGALVYSTLVGGSSTDTATSIAVDSSGRAFLGGYTNSANFPVVNAIQSTVAGGFDAFVTVVAASGSSLVFSSYLGGSGNDQGCAIVATAAGTVYVAGTTASSNFPTQSPLKAALNGFSNAFLANINIGASGASNPTPVSITPSSGSGLSQTFTAVFTDPAGVGDISAARVVVGNTETGINSCFLYFSANTLYLLTNAGALTTGIAIGTSGTLSNSQCSVNVGASTAVSSGDTLTLTLPVTFAPAYAGTQDLLLEAQSSTVFGAYALLGSWTIAGSASSPTAVSITPSSGSGLSQTFTAVYSDSAGVSDISAARVVVGNTETGINSCFLYFATAANTLYLLTNAGALTTGIVIGTSGTLSNSQCSVNVGASTAVFSGDTLTLTLSLTFTSAYAGTQDLMVEAQSSTVFGAYALLGSWTVAGSASNPMPVSITPSSGSGSSQTFTAVFTDPAGVSDISAARVVVGNTETGINSCFLYFSANTLYLLTNAGALTTGIAIGTSGTLSNSQCSVNVGASTAVLSGNTLTLTLSLTFMTAYAGVQDLLLEAQSSTVFGAWAVLGSWTVAGSASNPTAVSITPSSGSGLSQTFTAVFTDPAGVSDISAARVVVGNTETGINSCFLYFSANTLYLLTNAGALTTGIAIGTSGTLSNSQCSVNVGGSKAVLSSDTLTLTLPITFTTAYAGTQDLLLEAQGSSVFGAWALLGAWTIGGSASDPTAVSIAPTSGSGLSQTFTAVFSDPAGATDILAARVVVGNTETGINSCFLYFSANTLYLLTNAGALTTGIAIGTSGTLTNSQCSVNVGASKAVVSGNTLTLTLPVTFTTAYAGTQDLLLEAQSSSVVGVWALLGTWTVP